MVTVKGFTTFSDEEISKQRRISESEDDPAKREKARRAVLEMVAYNIRAARGDFDTY